MLSPEAAALAARWDALFERGARKLWEGAAPGFVEDYGQKPPAVLEYLVEGGPPRALVVVCAGGGYAIKAPHEGPLVAQWLNSIGVHALVVDYRVAPYRHPAILTDAQRALRFARANAQAWNVDPNRVGILGFSAGGHLAACAATLFDYGDPGSSDPVERFSCRPDAAVLCYPVISLSAAYAHPGSIRNLLGEDAGEAMKRALSCENNVTPATPPCFLWSSAQDTSVPFEHSFAFASALKAAGVPVALHVFSKGPHGIGLADEYPEAVQWRSLCENWLRGLGWLQ